MRRRPRGQATVESALLLALLLGVGISGAWVLERHSQLLHALDVAARSYSFVLSLPVP